MRLAEMSAEYRRSGDLLRRRLRDLRGAARKEPDPDRLWRLRRRIADLAGMLRQVNELTELTAHYYERGYTRNEKYTV